MTALIAPNLFRRGALGYRTRASGIDRMEGFSLPFSGPAAKAGAQGQRRACPAPDARIRGHDGEVGGCRILEAWH